ncbi:MAG: hypothetical protein ACREB8_16075 [Pseudolabrys sp.]
MPVEKLKPIGLDKRLRELTISLEAAGFDSLAVTAEFLEIAVAGAIATGGYDKAVEMLENALVSVRKLRENRPALKDFEQGKCAGSA